VFTELGLKKSFFAGSQYSIIHVTIDFEILDVNSCRIFDGNFAESHFVAS